MNRPHTPAADLRPLIGSYASIETSDCQAMALAILRQCTGEMDADRPAQRDGHPLGRDPARR